VTGAPGEIPKLGELDRLFSQIKREKSRLDVVFANAGTAKIRIAWRDHGGTLRLYLRHQRERPAFAVGQKALPVLPDGASIILNASIVARKGFASWSVYGATKAALVRAHVDH
jgi:NAD(P)-dependent dehydrogenase (short-subunit alcohol dehydrogenase family)